MGDTPQGSSAILGFGELLNRFQQTESQKALWDAQMQDLKAKMKAEEARMALIGQLPPDQQLAEILGKDSPYVKGLMLEKIKKTFDTGGGGQPQQVPLPDYDPSSPGPATGPTRPGATMSVPQQMAQSQFSIDSIDTNTGNVKIGPMKYSRSVNVIMPDGNPGTAPMREDGFVDMSKAVPAPFKPYMQPGIGTGMAPTQTPVNPYTLQPTGPAVQTGPPPTMQYDVETEDGGSRRVVTPMFPDHTPPVKGGKPSLGAGTGGGYTKLPLVDQPMDAVAVLGLTNDKGEHPDPGTSLRKAQAAGYRVTDKEKNPEIAGKLVMLMQGVKDLDGAEAMLFKDGVYQWGLAVSSAAGVPSWIKENSQQVSSRIRNAINGKLRAETGAQANPAEIEDMSKRFAPTWRDNAASARDKMARLREFLMYATAVADPSGKYMISYPKGKTGIMAGEKFSITKDSASKDTRPVTWEDYKKKQAGGQ